MVSLIGPHAETWSDSDEEPEPPSVAVYRDACLEAGKVPCGRWLRTCQTKSEECTLQHYGIGKKGSAPLGKSLRVNACVRVLDLSDNGLGTEGVQTLAKALNAACTPEFYLFSPDAKNSQTLRYRGQLDASRPGNDAPLDGADLRAALDAVLSGHAVSTAQVASVGCNVKWHPGQEPAWFG